MNQDKSIGLDGIEAVKERIKLFDYDRCYYTLRDGKIGNIYGKTVELFRCCLALDSMGLRITSDLIGFLLPNRSYASIMISLHNLGDKNVLTYIRHGKKRCSWMVNPKYLNPELYGINNE